MLRTYDVPKKNEALIGEILAIFYNALTHLALEENDIDLDNIDLHIKSQIIKTMIELLDSSRSKPNKICLPNGMTLSIGTCPLTYQTFLKCLLNIKEIYDDLSEEQINDMKKTFKHYDHYSIIKTMIADLATKLIEMESAKNIINNAKQFILEAKGLINTDSIAIQMNEAGITVQLIRETFYNEMVHQAFKLVGEQWISREDLEDQETFIYFALPAFTLIEAIQQSQHCRGIKLLDNKVLTIENCPKEDDFSELFVPILRNKNYMKMLSENELKVIKILCLSNKMECPSELIPYKTKQATDCATIINQIAILVSQREFFKQMIKSIIKMCLDSLNQQSQRKII